MLLCEPLELVSYMLRDLGITPGRNGVEMREQLKDVLVSEARAGRRFVVVIDEAQNMSDDALEMVRLLTNFETSRAKLMQIVLSRPAEAVRKVNAAFPGATSTAHFYLLSARTPFSRRDCRLHRSSVETRRIWWPSAFHRRCAEAAHRCEPGNSPDHQQPMFQCAVTICALRRKQVDVEIGAEAIADQQLTPESKELSPVTPEIIANPKIESEEPERSGNAVKPWAVAAAVLLMASVLSVLAFPKVAPLWSQANAEARKLICEGSSLNSRCSGRDRE